MTPSPLRKLLYALVPVLVLAGGAELGCRLLTDRPPDPGSRAEQQRRFLLRLGSLSPEDTDALFRYDPDLFWRLQPDTPDLEVEDPQGLWPDVATNSLGLRDDEVAVPKPPGVWRILCMGDSCTYGTGVPRQQGWVQRLEASLGEGYDVINAGVPGYTSYQALRLLEEVGPALDPDVVIFTTGFNDRRSWDDRSDAEHAADQRAEHSGLTGLLLKSRCVQLLLHWRQERFGGPVLDLSHEARTARRVPVDEYVANCRRAAELCAEHGARILFVMWPVASTLEGEGRENLTGHQAALLHFGKEHDLPVVDPIKALRPRRDEVFLIDDVHMTPVGNAIMARQIEASLRREGLLGEQ